MAESLQNDSHNVSQNVSHDSELPPIFNLDALSELIELEDTGEAGLIDSLVTDYLNGWQTLTGDLESAVSTRDYLTIERSAHSMKSSSALLGLERLAAVAFLIEDEARDQKYNAVHLPRLKSEFTLAKVEIERFRETRLTK